MNQEEFKKFVIAESAEIMGKPSISKEVKKPLNESTIIKESIKSISPEDVLRFAEEIKSTIKAVDFRNPVIAESVEIKTAPISTNKTESEQNRWKKFLNYDVPSDDNR